MYKLNFDNNLEFQHSIFKNDLLKICPTSGSISNLNKSGDITFQSLQSSCPLDIGNAMLYFKIEIATTDANITLENNWFPSLFSLMRLKLGASEIEQVRYPGTISTMLNFVLIGNDEKHSAQGYGWIPDVTLKDIGDTSWDSNRSYNKRLELYSAKKFEGYFPLKNLFGFVQNYNRLLHNVFIELNCYRQVDDKLIFYGKKDKVGKLTLLNLELHIPEWTLNPKIEVEMSERLNSNKPIKVSYLNRIVGKNSIEAGTNCSIKLSNLAYKPRYILLCFKDPSIEYVYNNNLFIQKKHMK